MIYFRDFPERKPHRPTDIFSEGLRRMMISKQVRSLLVTHRAEKASRLALREPANLTPEDECKINGKQKKLRLYGVTVFCSWKCKVVRDRIDDERRCVE